MLYHIVIIITFALLAYAVIVLFRKFAMIRKRSREWQSKESEFINKLIANGDLKPGQLSGFKDFFEGTTLDEDDLN